MEIRGANEERQHPWLLISEEDKQFFYNVSDNRFHLRNIPELRNKYVVTSNFGWLVLMDINTNNYCLWHPESLDKIELPDLTELTRPKRLDQCILSKPPTEPDCHILFIASRTKFRIFCQIGDDQFVMQTSADNGNKMCLSTIASFQGKIYGVVTTSYRYQFVSVDFVGGTLQLNPILLEGGQPWDMPHPSRSLIHEDYLIESSCGELLLVHKIYSCRHRLDGLDFKVFCVDVDRMECKDLEHIGERAIFVNNWDNAFCCSSLGIKPNSIYYTVVGSRNLFIYDLDDRSTTALLPCSIATVSGTYWVLPYIFPNFLN